MRTNIKPENRRLLEAIEYIDEEIVLGVLAGLKDPEEKSIHGEYQKPSPFKYWRQFTAMAACLILLTAAFPVLNYVLPRIGISIGGRGGNAGAGTSELEAPTQAETQALETEDEKIDSPYPRAIDAYPADMPAEEIYADVLKGGWVVNYDFSEIEAGEDLWLDFLNKVDRGEPARILIATYPLEYPDGTISIELHEVVYDGKLFTHTGGSHRGIDSILKDFNIFRFEYLTKIEHESNNRKTIKWMLTHKNPYTYEDFGDEFMSNNGGIGDHESIMSFYYYKN